MKILLELDEITQTETARSQADTLALLKTEYEAICPPDDEQKISKGLPGCIWVEIPLPVGTSPGNPM
jgi:hypothetical protein